MFHERAAAIGTVGSRGGGTVRRRVHVGVEVVGYLAGDDPGIAALAGKVSQHGGGFGRERHGSRRVTPAIATLGTSHWLHVELSRLLCDDGPSTSCHDGAGKGQDSGRVDGWTATALDAASRLRQEVVVTNGYGTLKEHFSKTFLQVRQNTKQSTCITKNRPVLSFTGLASRQIDVALHVRSSGSKKH